MTMTNSIQVSFKFKQLKYFIFFAEFDLCNYNYTVIKYGFLKSQLILENQLMDYLS